MAVIYPRNVNYNAAERICKRLGISLEDVIQVVPTEDAIDDTALRLRPVPPVAYRPPSLPPDQTIAALTARPIYGTAPITVRSLLEVSTSLKW